MNSYLSVHRWFAQIVHDHIDPAGKQCRVHYFGFEEVFDEAMDKEGPYVKRLTEDQLAVALRKHGKHVRTRDALMADAERLAVPWKPVESESEEEPEVEEPVKEAEVVQAAVTEDAAATDETKPEEEGMWS